MSESDAAAEMALEIGGEMTDEILPRWSWLFLPALSLRLSLSLSECFSVMPQSLCLSGFGVSPCRGSNLCCVCVLHSLSLSLSLSLVVSAQWREL